jgi:hypothetical protein
VEVQDSRSVRPDQTAISADSKRIIEADPRLILFMAIKFDQKETSRKYQELGQRCGVRPPKAEQDLSEKPVAQEKLNGFGSA